MLFHLVLNLNEGNHILFPTGTKQREKKEKTLKKVEFNKEKVES